MSAAAALATDEKQQIASFMQGFTIETTPGSAAKIPDYRALLRPGTLIAVTFLPGSDFADTVAVSKRLKAEGFRPAPHFAARSIPSKEAFEDYLKRLQGEVGIDEVVALGGAVPQPLGPFESSMQLLETGLFDKHGIKKIGVAGHPEGSPDITDKLIKEALAWKNAFAERTGSTLANGSVEAGARRVAGGAGFVRERLARPARAGTPVSDEPPTGSPVRGADASGRLGRRRQGDVRGCRTRFPTFDRQSPLSAPTRARSASSVFSRATKSVTAWSKRKRSS